MPRKYELKRRAKSQEETHQRIVEAAVALHQTVGGAGATISAIAARAGVERPTVYRHFPDERALLNACTGHYLGLNPPPDPAPWQEIADPAERLQTALTVVYAYHRRTEQMMDHAFRDIEEMPVLREAMVPYFAYWDGVREILLPGWPDTGTNAWQVRAAIGHALAFPTWRSLVRDEGLDDDDVVRLMVCFVSGAAACVEPPS